MERVEFVFSYKPRDDGHEIDAYDAGQALTGIARSLSLTTHYVLNGEVIKHATALKKGAVRVLPPRIGSFEFVAPVIQFVADNPVLATGAGAVALNVFSNYVTDLTKYLYRVVTGLSEKPETEALKKVIREKPGDIATLAVFINDDVVRVHRPISQQITNFTINGGNNSFRNFNARTRDYAQSQILSEEASSFVGHVTSYNANSSAGRFYVLKQQRTVGFKPGKNFDLTSDEKALLSWSLDEYNNGRPGVVTLKGQTVETKHEVVKQILLDYVFQGATS